MSTEMATTLTADTMEKVLLEGDLGKLSSNQRLNYLHSVCESLGLNPLTQPFKYIRLQGKLVLYATKDATDQLRKRDSISVEIVSREQVGDLYVVTARAITPDGRYDEDTGAVSIIGKGGDALANAIMKAGTKAKRRVTLSICGLGWLDETELDTISPSVVEVVDAPEDHRSYHWMADRVTQRRFWQWARETKGLSDDEVHEALGGVESVYDFQGTKQDAIDAINAWIMAQMNGFDDDSETQTE